MRELNQLVIILTVFLPERKDVFSCPSQDIATD